MTPQRSRYSQFGISMLEMVLALMILGVLTVAAFTLERGTVTENRRSAEWEMSGRADRAIRAFLARNSRLPCPAVDSLGRESCGEGMSQRVGFVPWITIGLPDAGAGNLRYVVGRDDLASRAPGLGVISLDFKDGISVVGFDIDSTDRAVHWCHVLGRAMRASLAGETSSAYQVFSPTVEATVDQKATALDAMGIGVIRLQSELWRELNCGGLVAGSGRAYMNTALAARMMKLAAEELYQLDGMTLESAKFLIDYAKVDLYTEYVRLGARSANAAATCANAVSLVAQAGLALGASLATVWAPGASLACVAGGADIAVHTLMLENKMKELDGLTAAFESAASAGYEAQKEEVRQLTELATAIEDRAFSSIAAGMNIGSMGN
ncbi:hypothetical protein DFR41_10811 [Pseudacidovorax intermedius]|uniref:Prepilin-type N-terminal cleavage/methylation domain-containing protein n=1 Tax=Pseudacidovorax intermedius TaxID=433924 RepID=A0A370FBP4_9BURK|nr:hypothetical protein [Pseudacidovorax intermedius]RDI21887.1 hypothetical protein DFR41_10811 [Pseudacidovorax intermedius]